MTIDIDVMQKKSKSTMRNLGSSRINKKVPNVPADFGVSFLSHFLESLHPISSPFVLSFGIILVLHKTLLPALTHSLGQWKPKPSTQMFTGLIGTFLPILEEPVKPQFFLVNVANLMLVFVCVGSTQTICLIC